MHIARKAAPLTLGLVIPSSLLSILVLISFVLPADSGERISLSITLLLTVTLFQQLTSAMIPRSQIPKLSKYFFALLIILMLALIANAIVINLHFGTGRKMPTFIQKVVLGVFGYIFCVHQGKEKLQETKKMPGQAKNLALDLNENNTNISPVDAKINPDVFIEFAKSNGKDLKESRINQNGDTRNNPAIEQDFNKKELNEQERPSSAWPDACIILDRLFLALFSIMFCVTIIWHVA